MTLDVALLIRMNKYPRKTIAAMTGIFIKEPTVICVGNTLERVKLERAIVAHKDVVVTGKGKLTAVMEICDRLNLDYRISYGEEIHDEESIKIYRFGTDYKLGGVILGESIPKANSGIQHIHLLGISPSDAREYQRLKGYPLILPLPSPVVVESEQQQIQKGLKDGFKEYIPNTELWLAESLYKSPGVTQLCGEIHKQDDPFFKLALLNMLRVKRPVPLAYPKWVKMK